MPGRDKTGPVGQGLMTGKGMGPCGSGMGGGAGAGFGNGLGMGSGRGVGCRGGFRKGSMGVASGVQTETDYLEEQKEWLKKRIEEIDRRLENK